MTFSRVIACAVLCMTSARLTSGQSLLELAQQEAMRRQVISAPARVIRTPDLTSQVQLSRMGVPPATSVAVDASASVARRVPLAPALFQSGALPRIPALAVSGGEVLLELAVDQQGRVADVTVLRQTPPFTESVIAAISGWRFQPAEDVAAPEPGEPVDLTTRRAIDSKVLIVGLFRPPALFPITLGQPPTSIAQPSEAVPAPTLFPSMPLSPPQALFQGVVLAELRVDDEGASSARVVRSSPGLDGAALAVLNGLPFRPARVNGVPITTMVYAIAAFPQPVTH